MSFDTLEKHIVKHFNPTQLMQLNATPTMSNLLLVKVKCFSEDQQKYENYPGFYSECAVTFIIC